MSSSSPAYVSPFPGSLYVQAGLEYAAKRAKAAQIKLQNDRIMHYNRTHILHAAVHRDIVCSTPFHPEPEVKQYRCMTCTNWFTAHKSEILEPKQCNTCLHADKKSGDSMPAPASR